MNLDNMGACVFVQRKLDLDAKVMELRASYYGEAAFSAMAADLLKLGSVLGRGTFNATSSARRYYHFLNDAHGSDSYAAEMLREAWGRLQAATAGHLGDADARQMEREVEAASGSQKELTAFLDHANNSRLRNEVCALPATCRERILFNQLDAGSGMWTVAIPTARTSMTPHELREVAAGYFFLPSLCLAPVVGSQIILPSTEHNPVTVDLYGDALMNLPAPGDAHLRVQHDAIADAFRDHCVHDLGIAVRREVDDLFKQAVPLSNTVPRDELKDLVPDAELSLPAFNVVIGSYDPRSLKSTLLEFKTMRDTDAQAVRPVFDAATGESARMRLTVSTVEGEVFPIEVDGEEPVEHVMAILEPVTGLPLASQVLLFNGRPLDAGAKLKDAGLKDDDLLLLMPRQAAGAGTGAGAGPSAGAGATSSNPMGIAQDGSAVNPTAMMDAIQGNTQLMDNLAQSQPELMEAIRTRNVDAFQKALRANAEIKRKAEAERQQEMQRLMNDPLNPESQARMMEMINQENVQQAYENAMEYNPELFGSVIMLYVDMEVNGTVMKAFVDSGAQSTIMSQKCAERLGIMRLCDKRFHGIAKGVGTSKIVGRVHQAPIKVGNSHLTASITILEQDDMEFLFGLDMLKRHQCCIDLNKNELRFGSCNESLRFLSEHELPSAARQFSEAPPTPSKPPGAEAAAVPPPAPAATAPAPAAAAAAAAAARAAAPAAPAASGGADPAKVQQLVGLGFTSAQAIQALNACGGDVDQAAAVLFGGF
eukprot:jgi/Tetstr1/458170/TSEL_044661.t1